MESASSIVPIPSARPYRSHKLRACDYCRKRKARCSVEVLGQACLLCRANGRQCEYSDARITPARAGSRPSDLDSHPQSPSAGQSLKRSHAVLEDNITDSPLYTQHVARKQALRRDGIDDDNGITTQSAHIVGPAITSDAHVLEQYMSPNSPEGNEPTQNPYRVYSADPHKPVLYRRVPRRRAGLEVAKEPGVKQQVVLEQVLAPNARRLLHLYLDKVHPAFPVIDENQLLDTRKNDASGPSAALICQIYAITMTYWNQTSFSKVHPHPDSRFAWNLAVKALQDDFLAPTLSTLQTVLVDLTGRPTYSITGNVINIGRAVTFSYSLGLNRDPSQWNISQYEKNLRVRIWWGILIHDSWGSLAHGTPSCINSTQYDVPPPTLDMLKSTVNSSRAHEKSLEGFIALCSLTEILGRVLPLVYDLKGNTQKETLKTIRRVETDLDEWEDSLPEYLIRNSQEEPAVSGSKFHYMQAVAQSDASNTSEALKYRQFECRKSAQTIVNFVRSLQSSHLGEFWLPYGAYYLTSTTTLLLRFAVETTEDAVAESCVSSVKMLTQRLRHAREHDDWDLADDCLSQCEGIIARMTHNGRSSDQTSNLPRPIFNGLEIDAPGDWLDATMPAFYGPMDGSSQMRDVWGMFDYEEPLII
ncbi:hypothetical protein BP5796_08980 [Coleophoma crateriformis]|uniref:Zn(2)-C6 fungal-type domain-containing protein n=1 Tax=Coleophoma crateriformis TaxID=565419 RepID=A0A3D8R2P4_9HELO|nr:hypothetical protein BP5796_08980 [Coleophoma crateriformis]